MAHWFSIRPSITLRGRKFKGLRGWAGKPLHPPLTDFPIAAYFLVMVFDLISYIGAKTTSASTVTADAYAAGTWVIIGGAIVSLGAAVTGFWDWLKSTPKHTQAWRTANWHMLVMVVVTLIVILDIVLRLGNYHAPYASLPVTVLSVLAGALVSYGATYGGTLVFDYGFNVETAGDHPVWHESEVNLLPGQKFPADTPGPGDAGGGSLTGGDPLTGGAGGDPLTGGASRDPLTGGASRDPLPGGASRDPLTGGASRDPLTGGAGGDPYTPDPRGRQG